MTEEQIEHNRSLTLNMFVGCATKPENFRGYENIFNVPIKCYIIYNDDGPSLEQNTETGNVKEYPSIGAAMANIKKEEYSYSYILILGYE